MLPESLFAMEPAAVGGGGHHFTKKSRDTWGRSQEFVLALVGFAVGLGNIWRFPFLCYKNGGGAFLIPYFTYLICGAAPLMFLEVGLGQFMAQGNISAWNLIPIWKGIGIGSTILVFFCDLYYIVVLAWGLHYFFASFQSNLPWASCDNEWNTEQCFSLSCEGNATDCEAKSDNVDAAMEYWERRVLQRTDRLEDLGGMQWELVGCLLLSWLLVYGCIFKGVKSGGKVVYFTATFPYFVLTVLLFRGVTLPGAMKGLEYYITPDFSRLSESQVWIDAGTQVFYSFACAIGGVLTLGSYNHYHHDFVKDCTLITAIVSGTSIFGGIVIFSVLGYMSHVSGVPISEVAESGPGLVFIAYPKALSLMPLAPFWSVLFFFMLILVAIDSQFVTVEGFVTGIMDAIPGAQTVFGKYTREIFSGLVCLVSFLLGLQFVCRGGIYYFQIFDYYAVSGFVLLSFCFFECIALSWFYGLNKWCGNVRDMIGREVPFILKLSWALLTPMGALGLFVFCVISYTPLTYNKTYVYPVWGQAFGFFTAFSSVIFVPLYFFYALLKAPGLKLKDKYLNAARPEMEKTLEIRAAQQLQAAIDSDEMQEYKQVHQQKEFKRVASSSLEEAVKLRPEH